MLFAPDDPLNLTPETEPPFTATIQVSPAPGGKKARPVWLVRQDGTQWLAAYQPDACWLAIDGQTMQVTATRYEPQLQALNAVHVRVQRLTSPDPTPADTFVEVGPEVTRSGTVQIVAGQPGSKMAGTNQTVFQPDSGGMAYPLYNPAAIPTAPGQPVTVVGRCVTLSPFSAHTSGVWLCVTRATP